MWKKSNTCFNFIFLNLFRPHCIRHRRRIASHCTRFTIASHRCFLLFAILHLHRRLLLFPPSTFSLLAANLFSVILLTPETLLKRAKNFLYLLNHMGFVVIVSIVINLKHVASSHQLIWRSRILFFHHVTDHFLGEMVANI